MGAYSHKSSQMPVGLSNVLSMNPSHYKESLKWTLFMPCPYLIRNLEPTHFLVLWRTLLGQLETTLQDCIHISSLVCCWSWFQGCDALVILSLLWVQTKARPHVRPPVCQPHSLSALSSGYCFNKAHAPELPTQAPDEGRNPMTGFRRAGIIRLLN